MSDAQNTDKNTSKVKYYIEGTVSEIAVDGTNCKFKICGHEGFAIKLNKKKYNILCAEKIINDSLEEEKTDITQSAIIFSQNQFLSPDEDIQKVFIQTNALGKKAKIEFTIDESKNLSEIISIGDFEIKSITLLSD